MTARCVTLPNIVFIDMRGVLDERELKKEMAHIRLLT